MLRQRKRGADGIQPEQPDLARETSSPEDSTLAVQALQHAARFKPALGWIMFVVLFSFRPLETSNLPMWMRDVAVAIGIVYMAHGFYMYRRWGDETKNIRRFVLVVCYSIAELLIENFLVWVAAASNIRKYDVTNRPLQDNVALFFRGWMAENDVIKLLVTYRWCHISVFLLIFVCMCLGPAWEQIPYSGIAIATRALLMHVIVRIVRTAAFLSVILPHGRNPRCYQSKFPPVPESWKEYIWTGIWTLKGGGGCNDLILSGHAIAWMMGVLSVWTYYPRGIVRYLVILAYIQTSVRTSVEGWHYSVDFIIPAALCWYVWRDLDWICPVHEPLPPRESKERDPVSKLAMTFVVVGLLFAAVTGYYTGA